MRMSAVRGSTNSPWASAASVTVTEAPQDASVAAATRPSLPLLPLPATTVTRRP